MSPMTRSIAAVGAVTALALAGVAEAATYNVDIVAKHSKVSGIKLSGTFKGQPFGTCPWKGKLLIPDTTQKLTCKDGTVSLRSHATRLTDNTKGTWKFTGGTGKFKGIKGGGTFTGTISTGNYRYVGTASY